jgi:rfaE bifunctional protein nucleotidyltransferase chain/domain
MESKIIDRGRLSLIRDDAKNKKRTVVFTNGCFDLIHAGHVAYLEDAKALGDILVVGLNSDASVRRLKGEKRPINSETHRALVIAGLAAVDYVCIFEEDTPVSLIQSFKPDIHTKGGDYSPDTLPEYSSIVAYGGRVRIIPFRPGLSSSSMIDTILSRFA